MKRLLTSCFGLGWLPVAPGTWGSIPVMVVWLVLAGRGVGGAVLFWTMAGLTVLGSLVCVLFSPAVIGLAGRDDPHEIVADEFAGQALVFLMISGYSGGHPYIAGVGGFLIFRVFDVVKPWPVHLVEGFPAGWGVLADDLLAAVYTWLVLMIIAGIGDKAGLSL